MKIIFLDIDGVLNCRNTFIEHYLKKKKFLKQYDVNSREYRVQSQLMEIDEDKLNLLIELCNITNAYVVVISSWKTLPCFKEVQQVLISKGLPIIGTTIDDCFNRGEGIINYIKTHNIENYIVIDDDIFSDYNEEILSRLVKTSFYEEGFTQLHKEKSLKLLKEIK